MTTVRKGVHCSIRRRLRIEIQTLQFNLDRIERGTDPVNPLTPITQKKFRKFSELLDQVIKELAPKSS